MQRCSGAPMATTKLWSWSSSWLTYLRSRHYEPPTVQSKEQVAGIWIVGETTHPAYNSGTSHKLSCTLCTHCTKLHVLCNCLRLPCLAKSCFALTWSSKLDSASAVAEQRCADRYRLWTLTCLAVKTDFLQTPFGPLRISCVRFW